MGGERGEGDGESAGLGRGRQRGGPRRGAGDRARAGGGGGAHRRGRRRRGNDSRDVDSNARRGRTFENHGADIVVARVAHALRAGNPRQRRPRGSAVGLVGPRVPTAIDILGARERRHDLVRGGDGGDVLHVPRQAQGATRPATQERRHGRDAREVVVTRYRARGPNDAPHDARRRAQVVRQHSSKMKNLGALSAPAAGAGKNAAPREVARSSRSARRLPASRNEHGRHGRRLRGWRRVRSRSPAFSSSRDCVPPRPDHRAPFFPRDARRTLDGDSFFPAD